VKIPNGRRVEPATARRFTEGPNGVVETVVDTSSRENVSVARKAEVGTFRGSSGLQGDQMAGTLMVEMRIRVPW